MNTIIEKDITPKIFYNIPSIGTILSMVLLLGTILTAHVAIISAQVQGPPPDAPASQLAIRKWS
jgi:hypothetical protein